MRVAVGGIWHETNTFAAGLTTLGDFRAYQYAEGADIERRYAGTGTELGGALAAAQALGIALAPIVYAAAVPSGRIAASALDAVTGRLAQGLRAAMPLDGVLLVLHGAAVAEGADDADGRVLAGVRALVGPAVPIVATLDFHANIGPLMVGRADALVGYDTYPHVDMAARGEEAIRILHRMIETGRRPALAHVKLPLLTAPIRQASAEPPLDGLFARLHALERDPAIWCGTLAMGFPYADIPDLGASVVIHADDVARAEAAASSLADALWAAREAFRPDLIPVARAVEEAMAAREGPVVIVDSADNVGGGAAGDGTAVLAALLAAGASGAVVVMADAEMAAKAVALGPGAAFEGAVGGKQDARHGAPVMVRGRVARAYTDARYRHSGSYMTGYETSMGKTAVIEAGGVSVVLTERRTMPFDIEQLRCLGIAPETRKIIVVKSAIAWRAAYGSIAKRAFAVDTPGVGASNLARFDYRRWPRPVFPLDPEAAFAARPETRKERP